MSLLSWDLCCIFSVTTEKIVTEICFSPPSPRKRGGYHLSTVIVVKNPEIPEGFAAAVDVGGCLPPNHVNPCVLV